MTRPRTSLVADASVAVKWVRREDGSDWTVRLVSDIRPLLAPDLLPVECANVFWRLRRRGEIGAPEPAVLLARLRDLPFHLAASAGPLADSALALASRTDHPVYDCLYLALAIERDAPLATADLRFAAAIRRANALPPDRLLTPPAAP